MRLALAACMLVTACVPGDRMPRSTPLADSLLTVARTWSDQPQDEAAARGALDRIAARVQRAMSLHPRTPASTLLNRTIFDELGFVREVEDTNLSFVFLPSVIQKRRGSCVGLGSLYLAVAERLRLNPEAVMVPGHLFVRLRDGRIHRNLELLRRGEEMPDSWYRTRFPIPGGSAPEYGRALTPSEVLGVIEYDVGNERKRRGRWLEARYAYRAAALHFPEFAEAHASLGELAQLAGELDQARDHYEAARRANPQLPGIAQNLSLLESELEQITH